ncbi:9,9'-di-cis-zeta-carotene desaturase [Thermoleptolyngbya sp. C42_A2020_037]|uniref:9,9'-di-cis-zeta-carotene desaturase n=1 Tax=Thermoleptolyngbya sp. C42_A2020_037 TaxID=2747799 RepID=UPI0019F84C1B|nr:9,9'-di-cis-zeta-carotene desaturase [Thermoleptolyngbya sp. C42_A2020_037]MBF2083230.1 9,9'-di-cis-zeta-carotene desaturase [Thermoleptolyngbya sp. C42_A2020_037]
MRVAIVGAGLAGLAAAVELVDAGHEVSIYEARTFVGGKVGSWIDADGNHIEMGLHVFFNNYNNLFALMRKVGAYEALLPKEHVHNFVNRGGEIGKLDFRFLLGAPFHGLKAFFTTGQLTLLDKLQNAIALGTSPIVPGLVNYDLAMKLIRDLDSVSFADWFRSHGGSQHSLERMWDPIALALGFINTEEISARCMLTIFMMFAAKTEASRLNMLAGSPDEYLHKPILKYIQERGAQVHTRRQTRRILFEEKDGETVVTGLAIANGDTEETVTADVYLAACDVPGIQRLLPAEWRKYPEFDNIYKLEAVPVVTVQLRFDGWVTEMQDAEQRKQLDHAAGLDNLLYSADADFSCFADLALTSPKDYYREGQGSLMQVVLTPGDPFIKMSNEDIAQHALKQLHDLFPSSRELNMTWFNVVKLAQSLYRENPGMDPYRPPQKTPVPNFFLAGSYTQQDYIDSMEGATISGKQAAAAILEPTGYKVQGTGLFKY